jgi:hypothetical protein
VVIGGLEPGGSDRGCSGLEIVEEDRQDLADIQLLESWTTRRERRRPPI